MSQTHTLLAQEHRRARPTSDHLLCACNGLNQHHLTTLFYLQNLLLHEALKTSETHCACARASLFKFCQWAVRLSFSRFGTAPLANFLKQRRRLSTENCGGAVLTMRPCADCCQTERSCARVVLQRRSTATLWNTGIWRRMWRRLMTNGATFRALYRALCWVLYFKALFEETNKDYCRTTQH